MAGSLVAPGEGSVTLRAFLASELRVAPGEFHLLLREVAPSLHLVASASIKPDAPLTAIIPLDRDGLDRLAALDRLLRYLFGYRVPPDQRMTTQQRRRLKTILRVADARQHKASQREIAQVLFGADRVAAEQWQNAPLRDVVRDLIRDGSTMIAGGYLHLLRFRRRR